MAPRAKAVVASDLFELETSFQEGSGGGRVGAGDGDGGSGVMGVFTTVRDEFTHQAFAAEGRLSEGTMEIAFIGG